MAQLQPKLDAIRKNFESKAPAAALEVMHRATADLVSSGAAGRAIGAGDTAPAFSLPDTEGAVVRSTDLLARGPLVITFFRGHW